MWTECDEVADNMRPPHFANFDAAIAYVRSQMGDQGSQIIDNVAESLYRRQQRAEAQ